MTVRELIKALKTKDRLLPVKTIHRESVVEYDHYNDPYEEEIEIISNLNDKKIREMDGVLYIIL